MLFNIQNQKLSLSDNMKISWETIGINQYPLLIVDNFYSHPEYIAQLAHRLKYSNPKGKHIHASATVSQKTDKIHDFIFNTYAKQWNMKRNQLRGLTNQWKFYRSLPSGSALPSIREDPHSDGMFFIAGLLYLTPDQYCKGGTGFYQHRPTKAEEKPPSLQWLSEKRISPKVIKAMNKYAIYRAFNQSKLSNYDDFLSGIPFKTTGNEYHLFASNEKWKLTKLVEMKFNRFIMYPAFILHKAIYQEDWFDGNVKQRRLTQNFFFKFPIN